jgi:hypothetical protein
VSIDVGLDSVLERDRRPFEVDTELAPVRRKRGNRPQRVALASAVITCTDADDGSQTTLGLGLAGWKMISG